jgi:hypothetical protein
MLGAINQQVRNVMESSEELWRRHGFEILHSCAYLFEQTQALHALYVKGGTRALALMGTSPVFTISPIQDHSVVLIEETLAPEETLDPEETFAPGETLAVSLSETSASEIPLPLSASPQQQLLDGIHKRVYAMLFVALFLVVAILLCAGMQEQHATDSQRDAFALHRLRIHQCTSSSGHALKHSCIYPAEKQQNFLVYTIEKSSLPVVLKPLSDFVFIVRKEFFQRVPLQEEPLEESLGDKHIQPAEMSPFTHGILSGVLCSVWMAFVGREVARIRL